MTPRKDSWKKLPTAIRSVVRDAIRWRTYDDRFSSVYDLTETLERSVDRLLAQERKGRPSCRKN